MTLSFTAVLEDRDLDVAFDVAAGETVALLGHNGAGKSSVLAIVAGLLRPDHGEVVLDGTTLFSTTGRTDLPPHRREAALLAQDPLLFPHLTVRENVAFGPRSRGASRARARGLAAQWLDRVGAAELADRRPSQISGGQAQRVAIARALAADPQVLLLDEPMAALDVDVAPALRQTLRKVLTDRTTVLVTHDALDALVLADRVIVLDNGRIVEDGPAKEVLSRPRSTFAARLAGLNMLSGRWTGSLLELDDGSTVQGIVNGPQPTPGGAAIATFRPHAVAIYTDAVTGSPRNSFAVTVSDLEPLGELFRVRAGHLSADVTPQAVAELDLAPGRSVRFTVKATEVSVYGW